MMDPTLPTDVPLTATPVEPVAHTVAQAATPASVSTPHRFGWVGELVTNNTFIGLVTFLAVLLGVMLTFWVVRTLVVARLRKLAGRTSQRWDDLAIELLMDIRFWVMGTIALAVASQALVLPRGLATLLHYGVVVAVGLQLLLSSRLVVQFGVERMLEKYKGEDGKPDPTLASATGVIRFLSTLIIGVVVLLLVLDNMNVKITPLLTGLGIGGIAVALAAQNILGDLFGSLTILFDKPFQVGDFIIAGDKMGTVERIGVKSTRVRALSGEMLVFTNSDLLNSRLQNFKQMQERRVIFTVGVVYETHPEKLRRIPQIVREAVEHQGVARFDRCHFKTFNTYSLDFETVYFVKQPDIMSYLNAQQAINLELFERFAHEGISFAYPTAVEIQRPEDTLPLASKPPRPAPVPPPPTPPHNEPDSSESSSE